MDEGRLRDVMERARADNGEQDRDELGQTQMALGHVEQIERTPGWQILCAIVDDEIRHWQQELLEQASDTSAASLKPEAHLRAKVLAQRIDALCLFQSLPERARAILETKAEHLFEALGKKAPRNRLDHGRPAVPGAN